MEVLVVVVVAVIIMTITTGMFATLLRSSAKSRILVEVKQNGNYALNIMERIIRNSKGVQGGGSSITITTPDNQNSVFRCENNKVYWNDVILISDKLDVLNCANVFTITPGLPGVKPDTVLIDFVLQSSGATTESSASAGFKIGIVLRNY